MKVYALLAPSPAGQFLLLERIILSLPSIALLTAIIFTVLLLLQKYALKKPLMKRSSILKVLKACLGISIVGFILIYWIAAS